MLPSVDEESVTIRVEQNTWFIECHVKGCDWWFVRPSKKRAEKWRRSHLARHGFHAAQ